MRKCNEQDVRSMINEHITKVGIILELTEKTLKDYIQGDIEEAMEGAILVDRLETEADRLRREIGDCLYSGAFLPILRKDIFQLVEALDSVADGAESCCDFCLGQRPELPDELKEDFLAVIRASISVFSHLKKGLSSLLWNSFSWLGDDTSDIKEITDRISMNESKVDDLEWRLTRRIFVSDLSLAQKMHLQAFLQKIANISDRIEDVGDRINIVIIRGAI